jgi:5-bromo-4-chloroindolyl phosphate hydrolysis protein
MNSNLGRNFLNSPNNKKVGLKILSKSHYKNSFSSGEKRLKSAGGTAKDKKIAPAKLERGKVSIKTFDKIRNRNLSLSR